MLFGLGWMKEELGAADGDPRVLRARDAYLEPFGDLGSRADLIRVLELATRVSKVARALVWHRALASFGGESAVEYAGAPFRTLTTLLDESYLGGPASR
jgi:hypothetical protein